MVLLSLIARRGSPVGVAASEGCGDAERQGGSSGEAVDVGEDSVLHGVGLSHEYCSRLVLTQVPCV